MKKFSLLIIAVFAISALFAQTKYAPKEITVKDYDRAVAFMYGSDEPMEFNTNVRINWINETQCWYSVNAPEGTKYYLVDAKKKKKSELTKEEADKLVVKTVTIKDAIVSPDGLKAAFIRDHNLWMKIIASNEEIQLTTDGIEDFGYATNNAGWTKSDRPVLDWSPDSKMIATFQHDGRGVGEMYVASTNVGHPKLEAWKYPLPGDSLIFRVERVVIHVDEPKVVRLKMNPDQHRSSITDHIASGNGIADLQWSNDSKQLAFLSNSRDHKEAWLRTADPTTGEVKTVFYEIEETFFESGAGKWNWYVMKESNEFIWFSQADNWGHLYLYDLTTGALKNQITKGDWRVFQVLNINEKDRTIYFSGGSREQGDPYYQYYYSVKMDGSDLKLLTPENANHSWKLAPGGNYFTDSYSTPQDAPITVLRDKKGKLLMEIEKGDISKLIASGWQAPESFTVKARDGKTDLYGLLCKPTNMDPTKKYPIINYIYPGPQSGSVGSRSFAAYRGDRQSLAELGFIVVALDAMGTPMRSKPFHDAYYGNMGDNGLPDQITGMQQLAERYSWIDIDRVGIYGHSGGGYASTDAILRYPDFFKVAVSGAGNHDQRNYEDDWGEKWQGMLVPNADGSNNYDDQANQNLAKNLKGKLLITHGSMDMNVPFYNSLLVVNELIAANKDFDLIIFPNRGHGFGRETYMIRKRWDFFVKYLLGAEPPKEYVILEKQK
ncbi:MAG: S9 family peptidase [Bacteroidetes bacterium HGW-Bacteroidetes-17]|nr:MAG: S9 family peptidase [Bacteroidetes bacterium HGW-Bacteroidetes-17]